jgi:hypothetical protein
MKAFLLMVWFTLCTVQLSVAQQYQHYNGTFFGVEYPKGFKPKPSLGVNNEVWSVFFKKNKHIEFYVYAPHPQNASKGKAADIQLNFSSEYILEEEIQQKNSQTIKYYTIADKNKKYFRSYQETYNKAGRLLNIIGIKYKDVKTYQKYETLFNYFRDSLTQFAD